MSGPAVASFAINGRGLGHASRLVAVHEELRQSGVLESRFFVEHRMELIDDYSFEPVVLPFYPGRLMRNPVPDKGRRAQQLARVIIEEALAGDDLVVLHDMVVHRSLYDAAVDRGWPQAVLFREGRTAGDPVRWIERQSPAVSTLFWAGRPGYESRAARVHVIGVEDIVRRPLGTRSLWDDGNEDAEGTVRVVVSAAGGGREDSAPFLAAALAGVDQFSRECEQPVDVQVITGPFFSGAVQVPRGCVARITVHRYVPPTHSAYAGASVVVAQSGYNTFHELGRAGVRHVLVPGGTEDEDQGARAETRAGVPGVRLADCDSGGIRQAMVAILGEPVPPAGDIGHTGAWQVAAVLEVLSGA